jgi:hypothetical protein
MSQSTKQLLAVALHDANSEHSGKLPIRVVGNDSAISIFADGYGDFGSVEGHGCPAFFELYGGKFRLIVFADINREDPTHVIDLSQAREDCRVLTPA